MVKIACISPDADIGMHHLASSEDHHSVGDYYYQQMFETNVSIFGIKKAAASNANMYMFAILAGFLPAKTLVEGITPTPPRSSLR